MNKEELLALGLSEEMVGKVLEKYGHMIPKTRLDEVITERNDLKEQITKRDEQLKELSEQVKDVKNIEELQKQITSLQEENKKVAADYETKISELRLSNAVETELMKVGALNTKAVKALLDNGKLKLEDGKLQGLSEQLAEIQKTDGYLFKKNLPRNLLSFSFVR